MWPVELCIVSCALKGFTLSRHLGRCFRLCPKPVPCLCRHNKGGHHGLGGGAIAGIVIGVLLALALLGVVVGVLVMRRRRQVAGGGAQGGMKPQKSSGGERHARRMPLKHLHDSAKLESPESWWRCIDCVPDLYSTMHLTGLWSLLNASTVPMCEQSK